MSKTYYEAPKDETFDELKEKCIELWKEYDDTYGYATQKVDRIKELENIRDNFMYMFSMLDSHNQAVILSRLSSETESEITVRL